MESAETVESAPAAPEVSSAPDTGTGDAEVGQATDEVPERTSESAQS